MRPKSFYGSTALHREAIIKIIIIIIIVIIVSGDSRETSFLFQRFSVLIQRFNSALITDSFCFSDEDPDL